MSDEKTIVNFGRNIQFQPSLIFRPESDAEVLEILDRHRGQKIRVVGSLHAWSPGIETEGIIMQLGNMDSIEIHHDETSPTVTVGAGCQIKRLVKRLATDQLTLSSIGLIDEQTVAGATATGTHGSGKNSLSHYIDSVSIAHYDAQTGEPKITIVDSGQDLLAARCSMGLLGIIVSVTIRCRTQYNIQEHALAHPSLQSVLDQETNYPQQQFYLLPWSWKFLGHHRVETDASRSKLAKLYRAYCFSVIDLGLHIAIYVLAKLLRLAWPVRLFYKWILPLTIIRKWKVVDDSHDMLVMEHELFRHIEIELFVQRSDLEQATSFLIDVLSVFGNRKAKNPTSTNALLGQLEQQEVLNSFRGTYVHHYPICYRRILSDETLMSMACPSSERVHTSAKPDEDWYAISLISYQWPTDRDGFFQFANFVAPAFAQLFGGRCHWGKLNPLDRQSNESLYPQIDKFRDTIKRFDPRGIFSNDWFDKVI